MVVCVVQYFSIVIKMHVCYSFLHRHHTMRIVCRILCPLLLLLLRRCCCRFSASLFLVFVLARWTLLIIILLFWYRATKMRETWRNQYIIAMEKLFTVSNVSSDQCSKSKVSSLNWSLVRNSFSFTSWKLREPKPYSMKIKIKINRNELLRCEWTTNRRRIHTHTHTHMASGINGQRRKWREYERTSMLFLRDRWDSL